jgi:predicted hydrocarbon binding protein
MSQRAQNEEPQFDGTVAAAFPLALLESVRDHDHPDEVLEDEDVAVSLPRRLGLTGVVGAQIRRYEGDERAGRTVHMNEVASLIRLVLRRPDADPILREAGQRLARWRFRRTPRAWTIILHRGPTAVALRSARRAAAVALRRLNAGSSVQAAKPFVVTVDDCVTARIDDGRPGCVLFTGLMEEQLRLYTGREQQLVHTQCAANGGASCEWRMP